MTVEQIFKDIICRVNPRNYNRSSEIKAPTFESISRVASLIWRACVQQRLDGHRNWWSGERRTDEAEIKRHVARMLFFIHTHELDEIKPNLYGSIPRRSDPQARRILCRHFRLFLEENINTDLRVLFSIIPAVLSNVKSTKVTRDIMHTIKLSTLLDTTGPVAALPDPGPACRQCVNWATTLPPQFCNCAFFITSGNI